MQQIRDYSTKCRSLPVSNHVHAWKLPTNSPLVPGQLGIESQWRYAGIRSFIALLAGEQHRPDSPYRIASVSATYNANFPRFSLIVSVY